MDGPYPVDRGLTVAGVGVDQATQFQAAQVAPDGADAQIEVLGQISVAAQIVAQSVGMLLERGKNVPASFGEQGRVGDGWAR